MCVSTLERHNTWLTTGYNRIQANYMHPPLDARIQTEYTKRMCMCMCMCMYSFFRGDCDL